MPTPWTSVIHRTATSVALYVATVYSAMLQRHLVALLLAAIDHHSKPSVVKTPQAKPQPHRELHLGNCLGSCCLHLSLLAGLILGQGGNEVPVTMDIVHTGGDGPELGLLHPGSWEGSLLPGVGPVPLLRQHLICWVWGIGDDIVLPATSKCRLSISYDL